MNLPEPIRIDRGTYWYLPDQALVLGRRGAILCKQTGQLTVVSSVLTEGMAFWAFERGILTGRHDLIITWCLPHLDATIDILTKTPPSQRGIKIARAGREHWYQRLSSLPAVVFSNADLFSYIGELMKAEQQGIFRFETRAATVV